jgi:hypothetical protein
MRKGNLIPSHPNPLLFFHNQVANWAEPAFILPTHSSLLKKYLAELVFISKWYFFNKHISAGLTPDYEMSAYGLVM